MEGSQLPIKRNKKVHFFHIEVFYIINGENKNMHLCCLAGSPAGLHTCWKAPNPIGTEKKFRGFMLNGTKSPFLHFWQLMQPAFLTWPAHPSACPGTSFWPYLGTATVPGWQVNTLCLRSRNPPCLNPSMRLLWPCSLGQPRSNAQ